MRSVKSDKYTTIRTVRWIRKDQWHVLKGIKQLWQIYVHKWVYNIFNLYVYTIIHRYFIVQIYQYKVVQ